MPRKAQEQPVSRGKAVNCLFGVTSSRRRACVCETVALNLLQNTQVQTSVCPSLGSPWPQSGDEPLLGIHQGLGPGSVLLSLGPGFLLLFKGEAVLNRLLLRPPGHTQMSHFCGVPDTLS